MKFSRKALFRTRWGVFNYICAASESGRQHSALWIGDLKTKPAPLLRIQSSCLTSTALGGTICDCADQLNLSFKMISEAGEGTIIYLDQEGRGHGLFEKVETMCEMNKGKDTVDAFCSRGMEADIRSFLDVIPILEHLGHSKHVRLITNNPQKIEELSNHGFAIEERIPIVAPMRQEIEGYLSAKKDKLGHLI